MFEVRLESVVGGKFAYVEHLMADEDSAVEAVDRHVPEGFSCPGLNNTQVQYAYGHVVDLTDNRIIHRKAQSYP